MTKTDFSFAAARPSLIGPLVCKRDPSKEKKTDPVKTVKNYLVKVIIEFGVLSTILEILNYCRAIDV